MAVELATAYISLVPSSRGFAAETNKQITPEMTKQGSTIGDGMLAGIGKSLKVGAVAVGAIAVGGIGTALVKGFSRLDGLDQATAKLSGLGHNAETVESIMQNALASVSGTAFGMDAAAGTAAQLVAAGIAPGADLERTLKGVADAATIAGVDMGSMGSIFGKVAASGKVQGDVLAQLSDAGVPALALLAKELGVTSEEASAMASKGEIDFATFQSAMENGMGGAALESGNTFSGAMDNMGAALGRVGANLLSGIFPQMKDGLGGITDFLGPLEEKASAAGAAFGVWAADVGPKVVGVLKGIADAGAGVVTWMKDNSTWLVPLALGLGAAAAAFGLVSLAIATWTAVTNIAKVAQIAFNASLLSNPVVLIVLAVIALVAAIIWVATQTTFFQDVWAGMVVIFVNTMGMFSDFFTNTIGMFVDFFTNTIGMFSDFGGHVAGIWNALWSAVGSFLSAVWAGIVAVVTAYIGIVLAIVQAVTGTISAVWSSIWNGISSFFSGVWSGIVNTIETVQGVFGRVFGAIGGIITGAFDNVVRVVKNTINGIIGLVNGVIGGINGVAGAIGGAIGVDLNIGTIPRLAKGGIVSRRPGGIIANIGEGRYDEAVIPLNPQNMEFMRGGGSDGGDAGGQFTGNLYLDGGELLGIVNGEINKYDDRNMMIIRGGRRI